MAKDILEKHGDRITEEIITWIPVDVLAPDVGPNGISEETMVLVHNKRKKKTYPWSTKYSMHSREWMIQHHQEFSWDPQRIKDLEVTHWGFRSPME